jgi:hypothetical protein
MKAFQRPATSPLHASGYPLRRRLVSMCENDHDDDPIAT